MVNTLIYQWGFTYRVHEMDHLPSSILLVWIMIRPHSSSSVHPSIHPPIAVFLHGPSVGSFHIRLLLIPSINTSWRHPSASLLPYPSPPTSLCPCLSLPVLPTPFRPSEGRADRPIVIRRGWPALPSSAPSCGHAGFQSVGHRLISGSSWTQRWSL